MIFFFNVSPQIFLCFLPDKKQLCLFVLTCWLLTHALFLCMVAVSLWLSHATGQHAATAWNRKKEKKKEGGWAFMAEWRVEEDNNIVNQMWLCLLLHSKPWHLPSLVNTEGSFLQTSCHKHKVYKTVHPHYTLYMYPAAVLHVFICILK